MSLTLEERTDAMLDRYGECVNQPQAARILGVSPSTINRMMRDGRLESCCGGSKIDVRSIARYIAEPAQVKTEQLKRKYKTRYLV